jgi:hypothetical protein
VYDDNGNPVHGPHGPSYNYVDPSDSFGHFCADVLPYFIYGPSFDTSKETPPVPRDKPGRRPTPPIVPYPFLFPY